MTADSRRSAPETPRSGWPRSSRVRRSAADRRGTAAIEAAVLLPVLVLMILGTWELGALVKAQQIMANAVREGGRLATGGSNNGTDVTVAMVQQAVRDYMTANGMPSAAVSGATITVTNLSANTWTNPADAIPLDRFRVTLTVPAGTAYKSLLISSMNSVTGMTQITVQQDWLSANDAEITVNATLPY